MTDRSSEEAPSLWTDRRVEEGDLPVMLERMENEGYVVDFVIPRTETHELRGHSYSVRVYRVIGRRVK